MNRTHELREQIDACRPGSDDLSLPELAKLREAVEHDVDVARELERSQRFDRTVMAAMQDVEIPAGLADRLLAATSANPDACNVTPAGAVEPTREKSSRREWTAALLAVAALLLMGITIALVANKFQGPRKVSHEELARSFPQWISEVSDPTGWTNLSDAQPNQAFSLPAKGPTVKPTAWRRFDTRAGERGVVYRYIPPGKQPVYLFVLNTPALYPVGNIPFTKVPGTTGTLAAGAWQSGRTLYVLVVDERDQRLEDFLEKVRLT